MKNYQIQPITAGEVIDNNIFYRRTRMAAPSFAPTESKFILDFPAERSSEKDKLALERHFNDLYAVFLHKLTAFALQPSVSPEEVERLRVFFDELLKARRALE